MILWLEHLIALNFCIYNSPGNKQKNSSYSRTGRERGQELQLPEDRRAPRGGSIQQIVTLVFKTFDLGQVNMHSILHLFRKKKRKKKKILYKTA